MLSNDDDDTDGARLLSCVVKSCESTESSDRMTERLLWCVLLAVVLRLVASAN